MCPVHIENALKITNHSKKALNFSELKTKLNKLVKCTTVHALINLFKHYIIKFYIRKSSRRLYDDEKNYGHQIHIDYEKSMNH